MVGGELHSCCSALHPLAQGPRCRGDGHHGVCKAMLPLVCVLLRLKPLRGCHDPAQDDIRHPRHGGDSRRCLLLGLRAGRGLLDHPSLHCSLLHLWGLVRRCPCISSIVSFCLSSSLHSGARASSYHRYAYSVITDRLPELVGLFNSFGGLAAALEGIAVRCNLVRFERNC